MFLSLLVYRHANADWSKDTTNEMRDIAVIIGRSKYREILAIHMATRDEGLALHELHVAFPAQRKQETSESCPVAALLSSGSKTWRRLSGLRERWMWKRRKTRTARRPVAGLPFEHPTSKAKNPSTTSRLWLVWAIASWPQIICKVRRSLQRRSCAANSWQTILFEFMFTIYTIKDAVYFMIQLLIESI